MDAYSLLLERMPKEELDAKIDAKVKSMSGFLTREAAARIIANEIGLKKDEKTTLAAIGDGTNSAFLVAKLERILRLQEFGGGKKMRKIVLSDAGGERELKLWNDDVQLLNSLHAGDTLEVRGIYCKNNELSLGYSGAIRVVQHASFAGLGALADLGGLAVNVRGYVESVGGMKEFEREGMQGKLFSFSISDGKNSARAIIWDGPERGNALFPGSEIKIENARVKNGELHLGASSRLLVKKKREGLTGRVDALEVSSGKLILTVGGNRYDFSRDEALTVLDARVADDIALESVVELKKKPFIGKEIFIEMKEGKIGKAMVKA